MFVPSTRPKTRALHHPSPRPAHGLVVRRPTRSGSERGFTLIVVILVVALMTILSVGLLSLARTEITTSDLTSQRVRAEISARGGLEEALDLLRFHTRHGNYVTAMPPLTLMPAAESMVIQEIYRPYWENDDDIETRSNRYVTPDDPTRPLVGDYLVSLSAGFAEESARSESRLRPWALSNDPAAGANQVALGMPYRIASQHANHGSGQPWPLFTEENSYNFNRITGPTEEGNFLIYPAILNENGLPASLPAPGQWVHLRDENGRITSRYAWFIEDESMKLNINTAGSDSRPSDILTDPAIPGTRLIDPGSVLPNPASRDQARQQVIATGNVGERAVSPGSVPLFGAAWNQNDPLNGPAAWQNLITTLSASDNTTARGWERIDLNQTVATNPPEEAAQIIADWIRDAWTGPVGIDDLADHQLYGNERLRLQIAANIVDYIDEDNLPTDLGDINGYPVLGIEKIPYLVAVEPRFEHVDLGPAATPGFRNSQITLRANLRFYNLFDEPLDVTDSVRTVLVTGTPILVRNGQDVLDVENETFEIRIPQDLEPGSTVVPVPVQGSGTTGVRTLSTTALGQWTVEYPMGEDSTNSTFLAGLLEIEVLGEDGARLDITEVGLNSRIARYENSTTARFLGSGSSGREAAVICLHFTVLPRETGTVPLEIGDPRYRPDLMNGRWYHTTRTDESRVGYGFNQAEQNSRAFAIDWYQHYSNSPKSVHRNGPMRSIGELGHIPGCEFPWQTLYLQYPERPANTSEFFFATGIPERRLASLDWVLTDLFSTGTDERFGQWNVNSQLLGFVGGSGNGRTRVQRGGVHGLFRAMQVGGPHSAPLMVNDDIAATLATVITDRRNNPLAADRNSPPRPFHQTGQIAAPLNRAVGTSNGQTSSSRNLVSASAYGQTGSNTALLALDTHMEQPYRQISSAVTTAGTVFRILYVGQSVRDRDNDGIIQPDEVRAEYLGEAIVERLPVFETLPGLPGRRTVDSTFNIVTQRPILE